MAIKGKKKQQSRGSQARRRPASAPRPALVARRVPWYRTDRGRALAAVIAVVVGVVWWVVAGARADSARLQKARSALEDYTSRSAALLQTVRPAAEGMAQAPTATEDGGIVALTGATKSWIKTLRVAQEQTAAPVDAPAAVNANRLFAESIAIYTNAARTYALVPAADGSLQTKLLELAGAQRDDAGVVWLTGTQVLDAARRGVELGASGVGSPAAPAVGSNQPSSESQQGGQSLSGVRRQARLKPPTPVSLGGPAPRRLNPQTPVSLGGPAPRRLNPPTPVGDGGRPADGDSGRQRDERRGGSGNEGRDH